MAPTVSHANGTLRARNVLRHLVDFASEDHDMREALANAFNIKAPLGYVSTAEGLDVYVDNEVFRIIVERK